MTLTLQRTFLFDHLPKTGGTALRFAFEDMFGRENVTQHLEGRSEIWAMQKFSGFRVISGHFLSLIPNDGGRRARLTVLRHPIDRAVSEYYYWRHHALEGGVDDKLAQWAQRYDICDFFKARAESNETAATNFCTKHFAARISRDLVGDERLVALASRSLEKYDFVGIFEYLHDSVDMFCWQFGFPPVNRFPHVNVTQARISVADLDRPTLHRLTAMNDLDVRLYNHALTIFEAKKRHMLRELVLKGSRVRRARFGSPVTGSNALPKKFFQRLRRIISSGSPAQNPQLRPRSASVSAAGDSPMSRKQENFGSGEVEIVCVRLVGAKSGTNAVAPGETVSVAISVSAHADVSNLTVGFELSDSFGEVVFGTNSFLHHAVKA
ncbi:MAG: Wzt carbohydrate-binding domain-containing protein, partial [Rhizomicrobium sp.]